MLSRFVSARFLPPPAAFGDDNARSMWSLFEEKWPEGFTCASAAVSRVFYVRSRPDVRVHYIMFPEPIKRDRNSIWHLGSWGFEWPEWRQAKIPQSVRPYGSFTGPSIPWMSGPDRRRSRERDSRRNSHKLSFPRWRAIENWNRYHRI